MIQKFTEYIINGRDEVINDVKTLLYKENPDVFEVIDFENDAIYREPLLVAYFREQNEHDLDLNTILYGYTDFELRPDILEIRSDEFGRCYLPNLGWLHLEKSEENYQLVKNTTNLFSVTHKGEVSEFTLEPRKILNNSSVELLQYSIPNLKKLYYDSNQNILDVEIEQISKKQIENVEKALYLLQKHVPHIYESLSLITTSFVTFHIPLSEAGGVKRNSFAVPSGLSTVFFNAYQDEYNEVFFVDDIAHQTGHIVFHALIYHVEDFIKADLSTIIQRFTSESRDILVLMHALYTYYATLTSLDALLIADAFSGEKKQEALGRMRFYIGKCNSDIHMLENPTDASLNLENLLTDKGLELFHEIKQEFERIADAWWPIVGDLDISNQPYNFAYANFATVNPLVLD